MATTVWVREVGSRKSKDTWPENYCKHSLFSSKPHLLLVFMFIVVIVNPIALSSALELDFAILLKLQVLVSRVHLFRFMQMKVKFPL